MDKKEKIDLKNDLDEQLSAPQTIKLKGQSRKVGKTAEIIVTEELLKPKEKIDLVTEEPEVIVKETKKKDIVIKRYNPDPKKGLSVQEAHERMLVGLSNKKKRGSTKSIPIIIFKNIFTFFNVLMILIAIALIYAKAQVTDFLFVGTILANTLIGIIQEIKAKKTIDRLTLLSAPNARVIRDGNEFEISVDDVVIDDIIKVLPGKQVPADAVVLSNNMVELNEALLTGESDSVIKKPGDSLYSGSFVSSGMVIAQVVAVGHDSYIEKLAGQAKKYKKPNSQLLKSLRVLITALTVLIVPVGLLLFYVSVNPNEFLGIGIGSNPLNDTILKTAGSMIGMVPVGLFLLTSMALAVGVIRLADNNTLVQELYCIELLARVDTLCLDKTGTITDGSMNVREIFTLKSGINLPVEDIISSMLHAFEDENATAKALRERFGSDKKMVSSETIPFSSDRKFSAVEFDEQGVFILGAPEYVLEDKYITIEEQVEKRTSEGYRVIVLAHSKGKIRKDNTVSGVHWPIAIIALEDSIRVDAKETVNYFKESGVDIKVISGDNAITVSRIAERAGINNFHKYISLENANDKEVIAAAEEYTIFGRVSPHQKQVLIKAMKDNGKTVAMTGDGVNDILALKEADTSIAMASGSDAAKNVSHLVLLDSNFSSMPKVVSEGRRVVNNVQKVATLFLTKTLFSILLTIMTIYLGFKTGSAVYPLEPRHLYPIEWLIIGFPSFFLALEYNNNPIKSGTFLWNIIKSALPGALAIIITSVLVYAFKNPLNIIKPEVVSTVISMTATSIGFFVLYKVSKPLNNLRKILFLSMISIYVITVIFTPDLYKYVPFWQTGWFNPTYGRLSAVEILLLAVLIQAGYPIMYFVTNIWRWIKNIVNAVITFFKNYQADESGNPW